MNKKSYPPTEQEAEAIDRAALNAAWNELQKLHDDLPIPKAVLVCLNAFKLARETQEAAEKNLLESRPDASYISHYTSVEDIVCSAMGAIDCGSPEDTHPSSIAGARLSVFLRAAKALEAMDAFQAAIDETSNMRGIYDVKNAVMLAEAEQP